jgi:hypothetical protein
MNSTKSTSSFTPTAGSVPNVDGSWRLVFSTSTSQRFFQVVNEMGRPPHSAPCFTVQPLCHPHLPC